MKPKRMGVAGGGEKARARKFAALEASLGYRFKSQDLLAQALTHASTRSTGSPSTARTDNERLEFLGDRVLGLAIAELLIGAYPAAQEGDLARRFNRMVRGETCAEIGRSIVLGQHLILSDSEAVSGGRDKDTILADAMEAVLGAIFLEAGFDTARDVAVGLWNQRLDTMPAVAADPKSALQEWAQGHGLDLPRYVLASRSGPDHAPKFVSEVRIAGRKPAQGVGSSKRAAEQAAATAMLAQEGMSEVTR